MPCKDCAGVRVELFTLKEFMGQWFTILMGKFDALESKSDNITGKLDLHEGILQNLANCIDGFSPKDDLGNQGVSANGVSPESIVFLETNKNTHQRYNSDSSTSFKANCNSGPGGSQSKQQRYLEDQNCAPITVKNENECESLQNILSDKIGEETHECVKSEAPDDDGTLITDALLVNRPRVDGSARSVEFDPCDSTAGTSGISLEEDIGDNEDLDDVEEASSLAAAAHSAPASVFIAYQQAANGETSFVCRICHSMFSHRSNLRRHINVMHQGAARHVCKYCGKEFAWKFAWRRHELRVHERFRNNNPNQK